MRGGYLRSVPEAAQLCPDHIRRNTAPARRRVEAAIGRGQHGAGIADRSRDPLDPVRHDLGMLDDVGQRVDHARHQDLTALQGKFLEAAKFVRVARAGEGEIQGSDVRLLHGRQNILERHVAVVRRFRIAPADVKAHPVGWNVLERDVDHCDDIFDEFEKHRQRLVLE